MKNSPDSPPKPPARLSTEAKGWWKRIVGAWDLDDAALLLLESALTAFDRWRAAEAMLAKEGTVVRDRFDQPKPHPATVIERDAKQTLLKNLKALNLDLEPLHDKPGRPPGT